MPKSADTPKRQTSVYSGVLCVTLLVTAAVYAPGLNGPFLLDDVDNLEPLHLWLSAQIPWQMAIFENGSGLLGRPLSMLSFLISTALGGYTPFAFKLGNLVVHLLTGLIAWQVVRHITARDPGLSKQAPLIATIVAALWLLHPLHASTVLYAVQRMAQLSAMFVLAALWMYLTARAHLAQERTRAGMFGLFVGFPLLLMAGLLSKETAAIAPALCVVLELTCFRNAPRPRRVLGWFFGIFLLLPLLVLAVLWALRPETVIGRYALWDFSLGQRLLTETRVVMDYISQLLLPHGARMGLYHDDIVVSTGLLSPPITLLSLLTLIGISSFAILVYKRAPIVCAGWFFFVVAHVLESSFLPMDLYFEHRNYLPAVGLLLAVVSLSALVPEKIATDLFTSRRLGLLLAGGFAVVLALGTLGRALAWQDMYSIAKQGLEQHPDSLRANLDMVAFTHEQAKNLERDAILLHMSHHESARIRLLGRLYHLALSGCRQTSMDGMNSLKKAIENPPPTVGLAEVMAFRTLINISANNGCENLSRSSIADNIVRLLKVTNAQPATAQPRWLLHHAAAELYFHDKHWPAALQQAKLAWQPGADPAIGGLLALAYSRNRRLDDAKRVLDEARQRINPYDKASLDGIARIESTIASQNAR